MKSYIDYLTFNIPGACDKDGDRVVSLQHSAKDGSEGRDARPLLCSGLAG
jgi:hypothetical protein